MSTIRLFHQDAYRRTFRGRVLEVLQVSGRPAVVVDRTCFYPASGGQPADRGTLSGVPVIDVHEKDGAIVHVLTATLSAKVVAGEIDWARRFDHMQQHSGQHVLSQSFVQVLGGQTVSFHLGDAVSTIDVDLPALSPAEAERVENLANAVVFENRAVRVLAVEEGALADLALRKLPAKKRLGVGQLRVVDIAGFDRSACGGTHVRSTGALGLIKIRKWERRAAGVRVEFLVGGRALDDYRWKNRLVNEVSAQLSVKDADLFVALDRLIAEGRESRREATLLRQRLLDYETLELLATARMTGPWNVVQRLFSERDVAEVKRLAQHLAARDGTVALLGLSADKGYLIFSRAEDVPLDAGDLLRRACETVAGKGGGRSDLAQGGVPAASDTGRALEWALREVMRRAAGQEG